ncbi:PatB family C-S lyase [soil metagenome]
MPPANTHAASFDALSEATLRARPCAKWRHYPDDVLPLWVADMDFPVAPEIKRAIVDQLDRDLLGYGPKSGMPDLRESVVHRLAERYDWHVTVDDVHPLPGIIPGLYLGAMVTAGPGEEIVIQPPVYPPFATTIAQSGRTVLENPMVEMDGHYTLDIEGLRGAITPATRALLLCNPQNPTGRVFERSELEALAEVVLEHRLWVVSDELHADLTYDAAHVPFASIGDEVAARTITLYGPTKTFNVAGLKIGFAVAQNPALLERLRTTAGYLVPGPTTPSQVATVAAYRHAGGWLEETRAYLRANRDHLAARLRAEAPEIALRAPEATYLAWLDLRRLDLGDAVDEALQAAGLGLNAGATFGTGGAGYARLNFATSRAILDAAIDRLVSLAADRRAAAPRSATPRAATLRT